MIVPDTFSSLENFTPIGWRVASGLYSTYIFGVAVTPGTQLTGIVVYVGYGRPASYRSWRPAVMKCYTEYFPSKSKLNQSQQHLLNIQKSPPTLRCDPWRLLYGNQNWQTHRDVFAMSVWLTVHIKHTALSHFLFLKMAPSLQSVLCSLSAPSLPEHLLTISEELRQKL